MSNSKAHLLATLEVRRNAVRGFGASALLTLGAFLFFVVVPGSVHPTPYYVALAFVLASSLGALLTAVFVGRTAMRIADETEGEPVEAGPASDQP